MESWPGRKCKLDVFVEVVNAYLCVVQSRYNAIENIQSLYDLRKHTSLTNLQRAIFEERYKTLDKSVAYFKRDQDYILSTLRKYEHLKDVAIEIDRQTYFLEGMVREINEPSERFRIMPECEKFVVIPVDPSASPIIDPPTFDKSQDACDVLCNIIQRIAYGHPAPLAAPTIEQLNGPILFLLLNPFYSADDAPWAIYNKRHCMMLCHFIQMYFSIPLAKQRIKTEASSGNSWTMVGAWKQIKKRLINPIMSLFCCCNRKKRSRSQYNVYRIPVQVQEDNV